MRIFTRYLVKEFLKLLGVCLLAFVAIYLMVDFLQKIDNFIRAGAETGLMLSYFLYKTPFIVVQMAPVAALISVIILFSSMKKNNEITAIKGSGISIVRFSLPLFGAAALICAAVFLVTEFVVPRTVSKSQSVWDKAMEKKGQKRFYGHADIWYKGAKGIYWIKLFNAKQKTMGRPTFYFLNDNFQLIRKVHGRLAVWVENHWRVIDGVVNEARSDGSFESRVFETYDLDIPETPDTFLRAERDPEEMSYWELRQYAEGIREEGYDATAYLVDMNIKLAFPLVTLIVVLVGIPIALGVKRGGTPLAVSMGIGACFMYLLVFGLSRSLGLSGILPPLVSAWVANAVFFLISVYLMIHAET